MLAKVTTLKSIFEQSPFGTLITSDNGYIEGYNDAFANMIGVKPMELIGKSISPLLDIAENDSHLFDAFIEKNSGNVLDYCIAYKGNHDVQVTIHELETDNKNLLCFYFLDFKTQTSSPRLRKYFDSELKDLTSNIPSVVFRCRYERNRPMDFVSETISNLSGWTAEELIGSDVYSSKMMNEEDDFRVWSAIGNALATKTSYTVEYRISKKNGETIWVSENGRIVTDENGIPRWIVGVLTNNSDVKAKNSEFEGTVNALNRATAVIEFDINGHVLRANEHFLGLLGYRLDEVVGHHHRIFCAKEQHESAEYIEFWNRLRAGEVNSGEFIRYGKDNKETWIQASYNPIFDADGKPYKVMKFATDLSQRREMENQLVIAKDKAEEATHARGAFLANMSHEIRTPMNAIIGFTEQMLKTQLNDQQEHFAGIVLNSSRSLLRLLNEILDMAKLEKGAVDLEIRHFNFFDLVNQVIATYKVDADEKGINLLLNQSKNTPEFINSDSLRIQQILLNLISNSIKFTSKGHITLDLDYQDSNMVMKVIDTGIGMKQSYLKDIFSPFTQSDPSTKRQFGGTGLGTAICMQLVQLMKGAITVESELGIGSTFTVVLPVKESSIDMIEQELQQEFDLPNMHILAIDDTATSLELLQITLEAEGHELVLARNGEEGVTAFKEVYEKDLPKFDMVITDIQMPKVSGFELCEQIRVFEKSQELACVPVIALSANVLEEHRQLALEVGMNGFATKPLVTHELFSQMANALEQSHVSNADKLKNLEKETDASAKKSKKIVASIKKKSVNVTANTGIVTVRNSTKISKNTAHIKTQPKIKAADKIKTTASTRNQKVEIPLKPTVNKLDKLSKLANFKTLTHVNATNGLKLWKKDSVYQNAISKLLDDNKQTAQVITQASEDSDKDTVSKEAHKLRGSSGNLSLEIIYELCSQIEKRANDGKLTDAKIYTEALPFALTEVAVWLASNQNKNTPQSTQNLVVDDKLKTAILNAEKAFANNQMANDDIDTILKRLPESDSKALQTAVDSFNFEQMLSCIQKIKKSI